MTRALARADREPTRRGPGLDGQWPVSDAPLQALA
jgi:hypothetical protein